MAKPDPFVSDCLTGIQVAGQWYDLFYVPGKDYNEFRLVPRLTIMEDGNKKNDVVIEGDMFYARVANPEDPNNESKAFILAGPVSSIQAYRFHN